jgi:formylglycine-generating enzyme required for sulfatase activity
MKFVKLPKATFYMGWDGRKKGVKTEIKEDFEIATYTVTQGQWQSIMGNNPSWFSRNGGESGSVKNVSDEDLRQFPVEGISWDDIQVFIEKLNGQEKDSGWTYRLPSEAEWEYACRGGATSEKECSFHFYFAKPTNDMSSDHANFNGNHPFGKAPRRKWLERPTKVGSYPPNSLGLYDMHGNVWQWCSDVYEPGGSVHVARGGSWGSYGSSCPTAYRGERPASRGKFVGFRLVRSISRAMSIPG